MNNFICEHCNNRMKEYVEDGGKSITFYCDCRKMVPLDEVIEIIEENGFTLQMHPTQDQTERFCSESVLLEEIRKKYGVK